MIFIRAVERLAVVMQHELFFAEMVHKELTTGSSAFRSFCTARKMLCLAALAPSAKRSRDLLDGEAFEMAQHEGGALLLAQLGHGGSKSVLRPGRCRPRDPDRVADAGIESRASSSSSAAGRCS